MLYCMNIGERGGLKGKDKELAEQLDSVFPFHPHRDKYRHTIYDSNCRLAGM